MGIDFMYPLQKIRLLLILLILFVFCLSSSKATRPLVPDYKQSGKLWPVPKNLTISTKLIPLIQKNWKFFAPVSNSLLSRAFSRYVKLFFPNGGLNENEINEGLSVLSVLVSSASETDQIQLGTDESYTLTINSKEGASIKSKTVFGALRGLETFSQLIFQNGSNYLVNETVISDFPRFPWRGLLIDTSRHWLPVETILDVIKGLSYSKLNTLHWHIIDGQSFPYESKFYPLLSKAGAYRPDQIYTQDDMKKIVAFANDYGVRVVPEFDMPAHATSWGFGYDFMTIDCFPRRDEYDFGDDWGDDPMDPTNPDVYQLIENFLTEATTIFPDDWLHLGGDEIDYHCWNISRINNYMEEHGIKTYGDLETLFIMRINTFVKSKLHKNLAYWQEVFQETSPFIGSAVDVWKDAPTLTAVIKEGIPAIQSFGWYLDHLNDDWYKFYSQEPVPDGISPQQARLILGGEGSMWGETVDVTNIHQKVWTRLSAIAERLWSAKEVRDEVDAIHRLSHHRCRYVLRGIPAAPFQPGPGCY